MAQGIEKSNHILAQAVDDNANAVRAGLAPTNGGANVFTGPNAFQQATAFNGGINVTGTTTINGTDLDDLVKRVEALEKDKLGNK